MSPRRRRTVELEQLWYGWSQENLDGSRGFGVVAASPGWKPLLESGSDVLGPAVAFPDVHDGRTPPASGGFVHLRGVPVVFRRIPLGSDDLGRTGSYGVRVVLSPDEPLDALSAAQMLAAGELDGPPPATGERELEPLTWGPPANRAPAPVVDHRDLVMVVAAVLQGLDSDQQVSLRLPDEPVAVRLLQAAFARLPRSWGVDRSFSTFETGTARPSLRIVCRLDGWDDPDSHGSNGSVLDVDVIQDTTTDSLRPEAVRWAQLLIDREDAPWRRDRAPTDVPALGSLLDTVQRAHTAPAALATDDIITLGYSTSLAEWAKSSGARHSAVRALRGARPDQVGDLIATARREPDATAVMLDAGWECIEAEQEGSVGVANAEALLTEFGVSSDEIDLARVRHLLTRAGTSGEALDTATSQRVLRVLLRQPGGLGENDWPILDRVTWNLALRSEHPSVWLETVLRHSAHLGPPMTDPEGAQLPRSALTAALEGAVAAGVTVEEAGRRLSRVLPPSPRERSRVLTLASQVPGIGMSVVFLGALTARNITDADRETLLALRWADFVDEAGMPGYLGEALVPRHTRTRMRLSSRGVVVLALALVLVPAAVLALVLAVRS